jgi:hypothetical protein
VFSESLGALYPFRGGVVVEDDITRDQLQKAVEVMADPRISIRLDEAPRPVTVHDRAV